MLDKRTYIPFLNGYFYISGSIGRYRNKKAIAIMLRDVSENLPKIFETENMEYMPHDMDLIYIDDDNSRLLNTFQKNKDIEIIQIKKDLLMLRYKPNNLRIDVFICKKKDFYTYYLFTLLGKKINIILRKKAISYNLLLNQYGLFDRKTKEILKIKYNYNKSIYYNISLILKRIYSYKEIKK